MTYNVDAATYLVLKVSSHLTIRGKEYHPEHVYSDYREQNGILYPHAFTYQGRDGASVLTATIETLEFNIPLDDERFALPADIE